MKYTAVVLAFFGASVLAGCDKKTESAAAAPSSSTGTAATTAAVSASGCDLVAFEKDQTDNGRGQGKAMKLSGCRFKSYNAQTKTAFFDKNGASDSLSCVNVDDPKLSAGDSANIEGTVDGNMDLTLNRCKISKK